MQDSSAFFLLMKRLHACSGNTAGLLSFSIACAEAALPFFESAGRGDPAPGAALELSKNVAAGFPIPIERLGRAHKAAEESGWELPFPSAGAARCAAHACACCVDVAAFHDEIDGSLLGTPAHPSPPVRAGTPLSAAMATARHVRRAFHAAPSGSAHERLEILRRVDGSLDIDAWLLRRIDIACGPFSTMEDPP